MKMTIAASLVESTREVLVKAVFPRLLTTWTTSKDLFNLIVVQACIHQPVSDTKIVL